MDDVTEDRIDLRGDGRVVLYKREGLKNPKWQVRIRVPISTGYKIVTTKTADLKEAERFALNLYEDLYLHVKSGGALNSKTFKLVFDEWEAHVKKIGLGRRATSGAPTVDRVRTYALTFFGPKKIDSIGVADFTEYWKWRKSNYTRKEPSNATLKRERACLLPLFKFAVAKGYISSVPDTDPPQSAQERRPTFTLSEWRVLTRKMRDWVREGEKKATGRDRFVAQQYFLILANTGMRVGEIRDLRWRDMRSVSTANGTRLIAAVKGKTGSREVVFQQGAEEYVKRLYDLRCEELAELKPDEADPKPSRDDLMICHKDGTAIQTMKKSFQSLLTFAKIDIERDGTARTIYSLRHFYATQRLSHETSPFLLAKQMGTSVEMLEKFYGQTVTSSLAAEISKGNQSVKAEKDPEYPFMTT